MSFYIFVHFLYIFSPIQTWCIRVLSLWLRFYFCFIFWTLVWFLLRVPDVWLKCTYLVNCRLSPHPHPITAPPPSHSMGSQVKVRVNAGYLGERSRVIANSTRALTIFLQFLYTAPTRDAFPAMRMRAAHLRRARGRGRGWTTSPRIECARFATSFYLSLPLPGVFNNPLFFALVSFFLFLFFYGVFFSSFDDIFSSIFLFTDSFLKWRRVLMITELKSRGVGISFCYYVLCFFLVADFLLQC